MVAAQSAYYNEWFDAKNEINSEACNLIFNVKSHEKSEYTSVC